MAWFCGGSGTLPLNVATLPPLANFKSKFKISNGRASVAIPSQVQMQIQMEEHLQARPRPRKAQPLVL